MHMPAAFLGLLVFLVALLFADEWFTIGVIADPDVIAEYHFGSEAMMGHGGQHYRSAEAYASTALYITLGLFSLSALLFTPAVRAIVKWRRKKKAEHDLPTA